MPCLLAELLIWLYLPQVTSALTEQKTTRTSNWSVRTLTAQRKVSGGDARHRPDRHMSTLLLKRIFCPCSLISNCFTVQNPLIWISIMANPIITTSSSTSDENALNHIPRTVTIVDDSAVLG